VAPQMACGYETGRPTKIVGGAIQHIDDGTRCVYPGRILQLIPAVGWRARYKQDDGSFVEWDLAAWALVRDCAGEREMKGVVATWEDPPWAFADEDRNFAGYAGPRDASPTPNGQP